MMTEPCRRAATTSLTTAWMCFSRVDDRGDVDLESSEFHVGAKVVELAGGESHMRPDDDQTAGHSGALRCSGGVPDAHDVL